VVVTERDGRFLRGLYSEHHQLLADEPKSAGGSDLGPSPYDLLLMALGACTSMTIRMYADRKGLALDDVEVRLRHERIHATTAPRTVDESRPCRQCCRQDGKIERIERRIDLTGDLTEAQRERVLAIADRCPVHRTARTLSGRHRARSARRPDSPSFGSGRRFVCPDGTVW
jgi:uncharacterized OsmC-like protein